MQTQQKITAKLLIYVFIEINSHLENESRMKLYL